MFARLLHAAALLAISLATASAYAGNTAAPMFSFAGLGTLGAVHWLISDTIEKGPEALRIAYRQSHLTVDYLNSLFDTLKQPGPEGKALTAKYDTEKRFPTSLAAGGTYDAGRWFVTSAACAGDFAQNIDFKLQSDHTRLGAGHSGLLINGRPDFQVGATVKVISVAADFVF